jgi:TonB-linked SusC/RagA family outer membrane protein
MIFIKKLFCFQKNHYLKLLFNINITILFISVGIVQVSAKTYAQKFTYEKNNVSLKEVFKAIKVQTGYDILWRSDILNINLKIEANFKDARLNDVLSECLRSSEIDFEIIDKTIILKPTKIRNLNTETLRQDSSIFRGLVLDESGRKMAGATVRLPGNKKSTFTGADGMFAIFAPNRGTLEISYIGYLNKQITLTGKLASDLIQIKMTPGNNFLGEVNIVSTGYQDIAKERATGSFEVITKEQLQHSSDPNLIKRLEGITTSMDFRNDLTPVNSAVSANLGATAQVYSTTLTNLTIRGKNTLNFSGDATKPSGIPLVVIDGVPSPYTIDNINPNDVESITVLKDAAAASIWGARAANGVLVVKTKKGSFEKPVSISFNTNFNITEKLNLFYKKQMSTSEFIDAQAFIFRSANTSIGLPNTNIAQTFYSPVAEILGAQKRGEINSEETNLQLDALRDNDVRRDFEKYILRKAMTQSYSLAIDGGSKAMAHRVSLGYDKTDNNTIASGSDRLVLSYNTSLQPIRRLEINAGITYSSRNSQNQASDEGIIGRNLFLPYYPYTKLADENGVPLAIPYKYRPAFINLLATTYGNKIKDLTFTPLNNINEGYLDTHYKNLNFNINTNFKINNFLSANVVYNYNIGKSEQESLNRPNSFFMRDLITTFTTKAGDKQIPDGGRYKYGVFDLRGQTLRGQISMDKNWGSKHSLSAVLGGEFTDSYNLSKDLVYYGFDEKTLISNNELNLSSNLPMLFANQFGISQSRIPSTTTTFYESKARTTSNFLNAAYTYNQRYTVSGSVRRDLSSYFGVGTNKGGTPFYSVGASWILSNESFYNLTWLPRLQLRSTFGYNGNVNNLVSARPIITIEQFGYMDNSLPTATVGGDATNEKLRPERTAVMNFGVEFGLKNNRVSGSVEYYDKRTTDLIANNAVDPSTGFNRLTFNTANLHGKGVDLNLATQNLVAGSFSWGSNLLFSYNRVKVTRLFTPEALSSEDVVLGFPNYNEGADLSRLYGYKWGGLDHVSGKPIGFANGQPIIINSNNAYSMIASEPLTNAQYFGSAVPVYYGSVRNTVRYGPLSLSANILFKLGYFFRRPSSDVVNYSSLLSPINQYLQGAEYSKRWQKPGDELFTNVPSMSYPANRFADLFYQNSTINILKADHARLQEINISYSLNKKNRFIKNPRIYVNVSNLGIIWRANKLSLDPDINDFPNPKTYSFGFSANL